jgi:hypothetical protein
MSKYENIADLSFYNISIEETSLTIFNKYLELLEKFHVLFKVQLTDSEKLQATRFSNYLYIKGVSCISHIFKLFLLYSNNLDFSLYYMEKSIYYYIEFLSQIKTDNGFIKLTCQDAILFVYKKTIFQINKTVPSKDFHTTATLKIINLLIEIMKPQCYLDDWDGIVQKWQSFIEILQKPIKNSNYSYHIERINKMYDNILCENKVLNEIS